MPSFMVIEQKMMVIHRVGGAGPTIQSPGRTNNCQIEILFKWSDQSERFKTKMAHFPV